MRLGCQCWQSPHFSYPRSPGGDIRFAAGSDALLIASNGEKVLHRFSLKTFQRERSTPLPAAGPLPAGAAVKIARMGCSSTGPLMLVSAEGACTMVDPVTLKTIPTENISVRMGVLYQDVRVSADGQTFVTAAPTQVGGGKCG